MRARRLPTVLATVLAIAACAHEDHRTTTPAKVPEPRASGPSSGPVQYVVADPGPRTSVIPVALGGSGGMGLVIDRARIVAGRGEPKVGADAPDATITGASRIPNRMGGGFLFWTNDTFYRSDAFDGVLKPVAKLPDGIQMISFAPKFLMARTHNGERWALSLPSGDRASIQPLGVVDIEALDDGRALAFNDQGAVFTSTDHGAHWSDVTSQVRSSPQRCAVIDDELWLFESSGAGQRLETDGRLAWFDKQPVEKPLELRARDPRWHGQDAPLREVFRGGALLDENTALVVSEGDIVRVDVHTGEIVGIVPGKAPPESTCEAVPGGQEILFACVKRQTGPHGMAESFVLSRVLSGEPVVEQTFQGTASFFASDDGGLVFAGPCGAASATANTSSLACVRQPGGAWVEVDASQASPDGGVAGDVNVARWVPRADGRAVALLSDPPGLFDPRTGALTAWPQDARDLVTEGWPRGRFGYKKRFRIVDDAVDGSWTFTAQGTLRAWLRHGGIVEVSEDGKVTRSPYVLDVMSWGPNGLGRTADGRLYQSTDHGASWSEIAGPPSGTTSLELRSCSAAGCDLGGFYRVGWNPRPPHVEAPAPPVKAAPEIRRARPVELVCRPNGAVSVKTTPRSDRSPDDLGLGNSKLPVTPDSGEIAYLRIPIPKGIQNPLHDRSPMDDAPSLRALLSGFQTQRDADVITVMGPNKSASQLRRGVAFVPPFDPASPVKRTAIAMSDVISAGRAAGMPMEEILSDDLTEALSFIPVTPSDPGGAGDLVFFAPRGLLAHVKSSTERVRVAMRQSQNGEGTVVSAATLPGDELAVLELETTGVGHVFKVTGNVTTDLFDVSPTMTEASFYPANPDALAVGPKGDLAILRTASGSDPASAVDPALLMVPAMPPVALAPWSTLKLATDPECKADTGWRATLQVVAPWIRVSTPSLRVEDAPMLARVKWNEKRVCLEGLEVKLAQQQARARRELSSDTVSISTWLVARGGTFARVGVGEGIEWRQPLECTLSP